ncbi:flagellar type III secretion system pore protein FliP [Yunchengibacter salinarum]|uniref:flagellar type III secretion system pore protein FliP n=1 Tax=Yunchengibacter salinarum TaxID=3133399 RepID=UPI0035B6A415
MAVMVVALSQPGAAQSVNLDLGESGTLTGRVVQLILLITVISLAPSMLIMVTSFVRMVIVFSILRNAMGTQSSPPNMVMISLAFFLTLYVMAPVFDRVWENAIDPLIKEEIDEFDAYERARGPLHGFMMSQVRENDLKLFMDLGNVPNETVENPEDISMATLIPAFMISEIRRGFEIGFLIYVPFLVLDMVIASVLMSMGMMMLPPVMVSMPFKLIFFVLVDGWNLLAGSLVRSFGTIPPPTP